MRRAEENPPVRQDGRENYINFVLESTRNGNYIPYLSVFYTVISDIALARPDLRREEIIIFLNNFNREVPTVNVVKYFGFERVIEGDARLNILSTYLKSYSRKRLEKFFHQALFYELAVNEPIELILAQKFDASPSWERARDFAIFCLSNSVDIFPHVDEKFNLKWILNNFSLYENDSKEMVSFDEYLMREKLSLDFNKFKTNFKDFNIRLMERAPWSQISEDELEAIVGLFIKLAILEPMLGYRYINNNLVWSLEETLKFITFRIKELSVGDILHQDEILISLEWDELYKDKVLDIREQENLSYENIIRRYELEGRYGIRNNWDKLLYYVTKVKGYLTQEDIKNLMFELYDNLANGVGVFSKLESLDLYSSELYTNERPMVTFLRDVKSFASNKDVSLSQASDYLKIQMFVNGLINTLNSGRLNNIILSTILLDVADIALEGDIDQYKLIDSREWVEDFSDRDLTEEEIFVNYIKVLLLGHVGEFVRKHPGRREIIAEYIKLQSIEVFSRSN